MGRQSLAFPTSPWAFDGERGSRWVHAARMAPGLGAAASHLLGFDVEVFPQRDVPNGLASADGEHQGHHVGVEACKKWETPTGMLQAVHRGGTKVVPHRRPAEPPSCHCGMVERCPGQLLSTFLLFMAPPRRPKTCAEPGSLRSDPREGAPALRTPAIWGAKVVLSHGERLGS